MLQESLTGSRQATTQRLQEMIADGRELARKIRFFVRVPLGSRSELLTAFGITPTRSKLRKTRPIEVPPVLPPVPPSPPPGPQVPGVPAVTTTVAGAPAPAAAEVPKAGSAEGREA